MMVTEALSKAEFVEAPDLDTIIETNQKIYKQVLSGHRL